MRIKFDVEEILTSAELAVPPDSSDGMLWIGPSVTLARTLVHRTAPSPPGGGILDLSPVPVPTPSFEKVDPELFSFMICPTTACLMSCSPMIRASIVLSAECHIMICSVMRNIRCHISYHLMNDVQYCALHHIWYISHNIMYVE